MEDVRAALEDDFETVTSPEARIKFLLQYAILAPSTHNSQPWKFKISTDHCDIFWDPEVYQIHEADPEQRDLWISLGCCIENLTIAANYFRVLKEILYREDGESHCVATVFFKGLMDRHEPDRTFEKLLHEIPLRVNVRGLFKSMPVAQETIQDLKSLALPEGIAVHFIEDKKKQEQLATFTAKGLQMAYKNPAFRKEMSRWMTSSFSRRLDGIPGYALRMPALLSLIFPVIVRWFNIGKTVSALNYKSMRSAPFIVAVTSRENTKRIWLSTGRFGEHFMLMARVLGLRTSIFIASIEMGDLYKKVQKILATSDRPHLIFCVGYMDDVQRPTPRHSLKEKLLL